MPKVWHKKRNGNPAIITEENCTDGDDDQEQFDQTQYTDPALSRNTGPTNSNHKNLAFGNPEYYPPRNPEYYGQVTRGSDPTQANIRPSGDQTTWVQKIKMYETPNSIKNNFSSPPLVKNMSAAKNPSGVQGSGYGQSPKVVYMNSSGKKSMSEFYRSNIFF